MPKGNSECPPLLLLSGGKGPLSIVRSLGKRNIPVSVSAMPDSHALRSRFCKDRYIIPEGEEEESYWGNLLLGSDKSDLRGSVIFAGSDRSVAFLANHRDELEKAYIIDDFIPEIHLAMLDKQKTMELASSVGCPLPRFWKVDALEDLEPIRPDLMFPLIIKPVHSHSLFREVYQTKIFVVDSYKDLVGRVADVLNHGIRIILCELIPGVDSAVSSSYNTYIDRQGKQLFQATTRNIRRHPVFAGPTCLFMSQWLPETAVAGDRFLRGIGFRGLANVQFRRDPRDGQLKLIECNPRFPDPQELLFRSGVDIAFIIYCKLTNRPIPRLDSYQQKLCVWYPFQDLKALRQLRTRRFDPGTTESAGKLQASR